MTIKEKPLTDRIGELIQLSAIYFDGGAPRTAAKRLRAAADLLDAEADRRREQGAGETA